MIDDALAIRPNYAQAYYVKGLWEETFAMREQAIADYEQALRREPPCRHPKPRYDASSAD